jgi:hypothetical protein
MTMIQAACGCKYKIFSEAPLTMSTKSGCQAGNAARLSPKQMAIHLGLRKPDQPEPGQRKTRTWTPDDKA